LGGTTFASACPDTNPTCNDARCGTANWDVYWQDTTIPTTSGVRCQKGSPTTPTWDGNSWNWICNGLSPGGEDIPCQSRNMPLVGACGTSNDQYFFGAPTQNLCGSPSILVGAVPTGTGPWSWSCRWVNSNTTCNAQVDTRTFSWEISARGACYQSTAGTCSGTYQLPGACGYPTQRVAGSTTPTGSPDSSYEGALCRGFESEASCNQGWQTHSCWWHDYLYREESCSIFNSSSSCTANAGCGWQPSGQQVQDRTVVCKDNNGNVVADYFCGYPPAKTQNGSIESCNITPVNWLCGSSSGQTFNTVPTTNLCDAGTPSFVFGAGPYLWTCAWIDGGTTDSCTAKATLPTSGSTTTQVRDVNCVSSTGAIVDPSFCTEPMPATTQTVASEVCNITTPVCNAPVLTSSDVTVTQDTSIAWANGVFNILFDENLYKNVQVRVTSPVSSMWPVTDLSPAAVGHFWTTTWSMNIIAECRSNNQQVTSNTITAIGKNSPIATSPTCNKVWIDNTPFNRWPISYGYFTANKTPVDPNTNFQDACQWYFVSETFIDSKWYKIECVATGTPINPGNWNWYKYLINGGGAAGTVIWTDQYGVPTNPPTTNAGGYTNTPTYSTIGAPETRIITGPSGLHVRYVTVARACQQ